MSFFDREPIDLADVTVKELWDAIARVDCESVCPGVLFNKITHAIYENRMFGEYKDPNFVSKIMREISVTN